MDDLRHILTSDVHFRSTAKVLAPAATFRTVGGSSNLPISRRLGGRLARDPPGWTADEKRPSANGDKEVRPGWIDRRAPRQRGIESESAWPVQTIAVIAAGSSAPRSPGFARGDVQAGSRIRCKKKPLFRGASDDCRERCSCWIPRALVPHRTPSGVVQATDTASHYTDYAGEHSSNQDRCV